uniref:TIMELESS n=1 Tax=Belgica antarctica TaxID=315563 RepID=U5YCS4_9DIPT|nr:TIMELESS [Belgica antarctica]
MELLYNPQIHSIFASLGKMEGDKYMVSEECMAGLEEINSKLSLEDHTLRTYRRAIGFGQNLKKDILPILVNTKDPQILDCTIRLLVNLTIPIECLLSVDVMSRTEIGRHTIYELNRLLITSKEVFIDSKATKAVIDWMKVILENDHKLSTEQCESINNCLLLLRNILHIPENSIHQQQTQTSMQNQILWNLFTQSIDKLLIHLISSPQKSYWVVTIVQLIALIYKDQHVGTLQKLLNHWFEVGSHTDSSDDNESNTSPPKQSSGDSSLMLTSDPTSDSSDNGGGKIINMMDVQDVNSSDFTAIRVKPKPTISQNSVDSIDSLPTSEGSDATSHDIIMKSPESSISSSLKSQMLTHKSRNQQTNISTSNQKFCKRQKNSCKKQQSQQIPSSNHSELSDCGYGTQASQGDMQLEKKRESISTSSNDDDIPTQKPAHQKPPVTNQKQRFNAAQKQRNPNPTTTQEKKDARRKKLVKRSKSSIINMKGLIHHSPTDEDISNILKEFTVDFLLKGYGMLVQELHSKLLNDIQLSIDTSHFFWLVTYFLKFAAQLELDLEHISPVMSFDVISYLTFEGVSLCEQLELISRQQGSNMKPCLRKIHLVVTAIREFLQALETYKKSSHLSKEDREYINKLQIQISRTEDLRQMFVLLLRCYNPAVQSRQYLKDLIVTNHSLLLLLETVSVESTSFSMIEHMQQFGTIEIMRNYGILLENFYENGEFVNECIFTMMHHVGGDLSQVTILFQPNILKIFSQIWETEYELCDDWSDLIEFVIHKFINTPPKPRVSLPSPSSTEGVSINGIWAKEDLDTLYWYYAQSKKCDDVIGNIITQFKESGHKSKTRIAVVQQLLQQDIISLMKCDELMKFEDSLYEGEVTRANSPANTESGIELSDKFKAVVSPQPDDIKVLRDRLLSENKGKHVVWLQKVLMECCFAKLSLIDSNKNCEDFTQIVEPIPSHFINKQQSTPLVPFNSEQSQVLVYQPFVLLLHKLGFHLPSDANKLFVRIPEFWTPEMLFSVAEKLGPVNEHDLKFNINLVRSTKSGAMTNTLITVPMQQSPKSESDFSEPGLPIISRCTPKVTPVDSLNWFQMVMQNKKCDGERSSNPILPVQLSSSEVHTFLQPPAPSKRPNNKRASISSLSDDLDSDNFSDSH